MKMNDTKELSDYNSIYIRINKDGGLTEEVARLVKRTRNNGGYVVRLRKSDNYKCSPKNS
jgi:hypothetical protein